MNSFGLSCLKDFYLGFYSHMAGVRVFFLRADLRVRSFSVPVLFSLAAAFFDGLSIFLLAPLLKGVIKQNFAFVGQLPVFQDIIRLLYGDLFPSNQKIFVLLICLTLFAACTNQAWRYISALAICNLARKTANRLRKVLFARYMSFGKLFFDETNYGYLQNVLINFTDNIADKLIRLQYLLTGILVMLVYLMIMFAISWKLTLYLLLIAPPLNFAFKKLILKIGKSSEAYAGFQKDFMRKTFNTLTCILLTKSYAAEEQEKHAFAKSSDCIEKLRFSMDKKTSMVSPLNRVVMLIVLLSCVAVIAKLLSKGVLEISQIMIYFYMLRENLIHFEDLVQFKAELASINGQIKEISKMFSDQKKHFVTGGNKVFRKLETGVVFKHLNFSYRKDMPVLKDMSMVIPKGKTIGIAGATGTGKTTLISLILRFYDAPAGTIFLDDTDIRKFTIGSLMRHIAYVSQDPLLFHGTIRENIAYGLNEISDETIIKAMEKADLSDFLTGLPQGLNTVIGDRGIRISGGEKQRVSIARAILKNAEILILDEATSSLDSESEKKIRETTSRLIKDKTAIIIAHRLSTIQNADKIFVLEQGTVQEQGTFNELLKKKGRFFQYWQKQNLSVE